MKLTILSDNNTLINTSFCGEAGLSMFIEDEDKKILFDTGYSNLFIKNSVKIGINLRKTDYLVFSHGHNDHTWGLLPFIKLFSETNISSRPKIIAHPQAFNSKCIEKIGEIGSLISKEKLENIFELKINKNPFWITKNLVFLGEIPRNNDFEGKTSIGKIYHNNELIDDYIHDDSALIYKTNCGLVIITGCSHSGICNIIEYAKEVCSENKVLDIVGGFHLLNPNKEQLSKTIEYIKKLELKQLHPCHCTDLQSKIELSKIVHIKEVGVGLKIEYN